MSPYKSLRKLIAQPDEKIKQLSITFSDEEPLPDTLGRLEYIERLIFACEGWEVRSLSDLPERLAELKGLKSIQLHYFLWKRFPKLLLQFPLLEELVIMPSTKDSKIAKRLEGIELLGQLTTLKILKISNFASVPLPKEIGNLQQLEILDITWNNLKTLPDELANLKKLKQLNVYGNPFEQFPNVIFKLPKLKMLELSLPQLKDFPEGLLRLNMGKDGLIFSSLGSQTYSHLPLRFLPKIWRIIKENNWNYKQSLFLFNALKADRQDFSDCTQEESLLLLNSEIDPYLQAAWANYEKNSEQKGLALPQKGEKILLLGTLAAEKSYWKEKLKDFDIQLITKEKKTKENRAEKQTEEAYHHVLLGASPGLVQSFLENKIIWTERLLKKYIDEVEKPFLLQKEEGETDENPYTEQLKSLLLSRQATNIEMALAMIKTGGLPKGLLTAFFILHKIIQSDAKVKKTLMTYLQQYAEPSVVSAFKRRFEVVGNNWMEDEVLFRNLHFYKTAIPELDLYELCIFLKDFQLYPTTTICTRYGLALLSGEEVLRFIESAKLWDAYTGTLNLTNIRIKNIPDEVAQLPVRRLLLKGADFYNRATSVASLPIVVSRLKELEYLDLSGFRYSFQIPDEVLKMPSLRCIRINKDYIDNISLRVKNNALNPNLQWEEGA